jgi:hypothetical protein
LRRSALVAARSTCGPRCRKESGLNGKRMG